MALKFYQPKAKFFNSDDIKKLSNVNLIMEERKMFNISGSPIIILSKLPYCFRIFPIFCRSTQHIAVSDRRLSELVGGLLCCEADCPCYYWRLSLIIKSVFDL